LSHDIECFEKLHSSTTQEVKMIPLHNLFASDPNTLAATQNIPESESDSTLETFRGALFDAVSDRSVRPETNQTTITRATEDLSSDASERTAPPTPGTPASSTSSSASSNSSDAASGPPDGGYNPFLQASYEASHGSSTGSSTPVAPATTPAATADVESATPSASDLPTSAAQAEASQSSIDEQQAFDNEYWASQPAAVQQLRYIQNPTERTQLATQLAGEGYSIDVPIMVWGWDPSITTGLREQEGYTWVPSALQNPVEMAPGLPAVGSQAAYNPNQPPAGSIMV
jgi:hypothetical protein